MTSAADRREMGALIDEAIASGARQAAACAEPGLDPRTLQRWTCPEGEPRADHRPCAARPVPTNRLTEAERDLIVVTCSSPEFASLPPSQIVPKLADEGEYIASESSFYRVLRECGSFPPPGSRPPAQMEHMATCACNR